MTKTLIAGANMPINAQTLEININSQTATDVSAYLLDTNTQQVRGDDDMVFYGQTTNANQSVSLLSQNNPYRFRLLLGNISESIGKIAFAVTPDGTETLQRIDVKIMGDGQLLGVGQIDCTGRLELALIVGEVYRHQGGWKFRLVGQGFNGGLRPLAEYFGVNIADDAPPSTPVKPAPVNLSKITLTKSNNRINLSKQNTGFGTIKINLNWNRGGQQTVAPTKQKSFFDRLLSGTPSTHKGVDLDLGCFYELQDGTRGIVQALGGQFGSYQSAPFVQLSADDRTGTTSDGEWLTINGEQWAKIKRLVIYAFIYEGAANWAATDGVVRLFAPNQPEIEIALTGDNRNLNMCAIAVLTNTQGGIEITRRVDYVSGHQVLDKLFGFGLRWTRGSK